MPAPSSRRRWARRLSAIISAVFSASRPISLLVRAGLARAADDGWEGVFVLGEPAYYRRFGFDPALARGFASPYAVPSLMAVMLKDTFPATTGKIEHAPAFTGLG